VQDRFGKVEYIPEGHTAIKAIRLAETAGLVDDAKRMTAQFEDYQARSAEYHGKYRDEKTRLEAEFARKINNKEQASNTLETQHKELDEKRRNWHDRTRYIILTAVTVAVIIGFFLFCKGFPDKHDLLSDVIFAALSIFIGLSSLFLTVPISSLVSNSLSKQMDAVSKQKRPLQDDISALRNQMYTEQKALFVKYYGEHGSKPLNQ
jgi:nitrogen fixation/metabolism regulation signal transduction histidine kinase